MVAGAGAGYYYGGNVQYAILGANLGQMAGGIAHGVFSSRTTSAPAVAEIQRGGVQTPRVGYLERWGLYFKHRRLLKQLAKQDVLLEDIDVARTRSAVFGLMGELTAGGGREIGLLRTRAGLVLRRGVVENGKEILKTTGASRIIAHTHPGGVLGLSSADYGTQGMREARTMHELGHVLDDLARPGLFARARQQGFGLMNYYEAERTAYYMQYGRYRPVLAGFNAASQTYRVTMKTVVIGGTTYAVYEAHDEILWIVGAAD